MDDLHPAIESIFRLLGHEGAPLRLTLIMDRDEAPDIPNSCYPEDCWSLELSDHIERMRLKYAKGENREGRVEVRWSGSLFCKPFFEYIRNFNETGWDLLESDLGSSPIICEQALLDHIAFTIRRKVGSVSP